MAEEKTDEVKPEATPAESNSEAEQSSPAAAETTPPRKKKVNQMNAAEIEAKLKQIQEQQGGLTSKYAEHLLKRKNNLSS